MYDLKDLRVGSNRDVRMTRQTFGHLGLARPSRFTPAGGRFCRCQAAVLFPLLFLIRLQFYGSMRNSGRA